MDTIINSFIDLDTGTILKNKLHARCGVSFSFKGKALRMVERNCFVASTIDNKPSFCGECKKKSIFCHTDCTFVIIKQDDILLVERLVKERSRNTQKNLYLIVMVQGQKVLIALPWMVACIENNTFYFSEEVM